MLDHPDFGMLKTEKHAGKPLDYFQAWSVNRCLFIGEAKDPPTKNYKNRDRGSPSSSYKMFYYL